MESNKEKEVNEYNDEKQVVQGGVKQKETKNGIKIIQPIGIGGRNIFNNIIINSGFDRILFILSIKTIINRNFNYLKKIQLKND